MKKYGLLFLLGLSTLFAYSKQTTMIVIETPYGNMTAKLYDETPKHRDNFIKLIQQGFYQDLLFHRVIKEFMIQGGDPESKNAPAGKMLGAGDVGYTVPAEFNPQFYHKKGALCAARQADQVNPQKASSGCQFYIVQGKKYNDGQLKQMEVAMAQQAQQNYFQKLAIDHKEEIKQLRLKRDSAGLMALQDQLIAQVKKEFASKKVQMTEAQKNDYKTLGGTPFLDQEYTVFGEIVEGLDVIDSIAAVACGAGDRPKEDIRFSIKIVED